MKLYVTDPDVLEKLFLPSNLHKLPPNRAKIGQIGFLNVKKIFSLIVTEFVM